MSELDDQLDAALAREKTAQEALIEEIATRRALVHGMKGVLKAAITVGGAALAGTQAAPAAPVLKLLAEKLADAAIDEIARGV